MKSFDREDDDDGGEDEEMGMLGISTFEEEEFEIIDDDISYEYIPDIDGPPPLMIEIDDDLPLTPFSDIVECDSDDEEEDEEEEEAQNRAAMVNAIEKQLKITREIKKVEDSADPLQAPEMDPWKSNSVSSALIRGTQDTKAITNPFGILSEVEQTPAIDQANTSSIDRILQNLKSIDTSVSSPSISPILKVGSNAQATTEHFRIDSLVDSPPGLERDIRVVISGMGSEIVIVGKRVENADAMVLLTSFFACSIFG